MARFAQIAKGTRARKPVPFPSANQRCSLLADLPELAAQRAADKVAWEVATRAGSAPPFAPDAEVLVDLRVLSGGEEAAVLQKARAYAIEKGVETPKDGDPLYELAKMAETLAVGVIDHDSPEDAPGPFFDSADQILNGSEGVDGLDGDRIAFLFARYQAWQDECSPQISSMTNEQYCSMMVRIATSDDDSFLAQTRQGTVAALLRTTAALLLSSPAGKSVFTSVFGGPPKPAQNEASPTKSPKHSASAKRQVRK